MPGFFHALGVDVELTAQLVCGGLSVVYDVLSVKKRGFMAFRDEIVKQYATPAECAEAYEVLVCRQLAHYWELHPVQGCHHKDWVADDEHRRQRA